MRAKLGKLAPPVLPKQEPAPPKIGVVVAEKQVVAAVPPLSSGKSVENPRMALLKQQSKAVSNRLSLWNFRFCWFEQKICFHQEIRIFE